MILTEPDEPTTAGYYVMTTTGGQPGALVNMEFANLIANPDTTSLDGLGYYPTLGCGAVVSR
jgi:hypothetical protein